MFRDTYPVVDVTRPTDYDSVVNNTQLPMYIQLLLHKVRLLLIDAAIERYVRHLSAQ